MFELETAIADWKQSFGGRDAINADGILELEAHLRELVIDLTRGGLSQREALMIGADRLGHPTELEREYSKVSVGALWRKRIFWMLSGYIAMTVGGAVVSTIVAITGMGLAIAGVGGSATGAVMITVMALGWSGLLLLAYRLSQNLENRPQRQWFVGAGIMLIVAPLVTFGARAAQMRIVNTSGYGESWMLLSIGGVGIQFCVLVFCFIVMCKFSEPTINAVE